MTTYIEDWQEEIENEIDIKNEDVEILWKKNWAWITFNFSEGTISPLIKLKKEKVKKYLACKVGSAHFVMRNNDFFDACESGN